MRETAGRGRPLNAQDFAPASKTLTTPSDNPGNLDVVELQSRVAGIKSDFDALFADLDTATADAGALQTEAAVELLRQRLSDIAGAGVPHAFPLSAQGFGDIERESLSVQSKSLHDRYETVKSAYAGKLTKVTAAGT